MNTQKTPGAYDKGPLTRNRFHAESAQGTPTTPPPSRGIRTSSSPTTGRVSQSSQPTSPTKTTSTSQPIAFTLSPAAAATPRSPSAQKPTNKRPGDHIQSPQALKIARTEQAPAVPQALPLRTTSPQSQQPVTEDAANNPIKKQIELAKQLLEDGNFLEAKQAFVSILGITEISESEKKSVYIPLEHVYYKLEDYASAKNIHEMALNITKPSEHSRRAYLCKSLGNIHLREGDYDKAEWLYQKGLRITKSKNHRIGLYIGLSQVYLKKEQYEKAQELIQEAFESAINTEDKVNLHISSGKAFLIQQKYEEAKIAFEEGLNTPEITNDLENQLRRLLRKALCKLGDYTSIEQDYKERLASPNISDEVKCNLHRKLSKVYSALTDNSKAMAYAIIALSYTKSLADGNKYKTKTIQRCETYGAHEAITQKLVELFQAENSTLTKKEIWLALATLADFNIN